MPSDSKFAVLIDADNVSAKYIKIIIDEISKDGVATYKRIYGDWTNPALVSWKSILLDYSVLPVQQYSYTTGKNSTDSALIIDAMDILYSGRVDGFCIVSSDSDFTRLAARLRESAMTVIGMGESKTPNSFIAACNKFKYLDLISRAQEDEARLLGKAKKSAVHKETAAKDEPKTNLSTLRGALRTIVRENAEEDDWMFVGKVGQMLGKRYPDFDVRNYGYTKLTRFLDSLDLFEMKSEQKDNNAPLFYVRLK